MTIAEQFDQMVDLLFASQNDCVTKTTGVALALQLVEQARDEMASLIINAEVDLSVAADVLEEIGRIELDVPICVKERRQLLEQCLLESKSNWVRGGALRGLSYMNDKQSIPIIEQALKEEDNPRLKDYMVQVINGLHR